MLNRSNRTLRASGVLAPGMLQRRALLSPEQAGQLMRLFKTFGNDTRLRLLHALVRADTICVTDLAASVGMKPQAVSNQLQRLVDRGIVAARRVGSNVYYRVVDPCVPALLDHGLCLIECNPETPSQEPHHAPHSRRTDRRRSAGDRQ